MSEPTVTIPLRVAFIAARLMNFNMKFGGEKFKTEIDKIQHEIIAAICDQCSQEQINVAKVAVKMQESQFV